MNTYRYTTAINQHTGGREYHIQWKSKMDPIAVCDDQRDAVAIVDALNAAENKNVHHEGWKSTKDTLPDPDTEVLVWDGEYFMLCELDGDDWVNDHGEVLVPNPTHWSNPIPPES